MTLYLEVSLSKLRFEKKVAFLQHEPSFLNAAMGSSTNDVTQFWIIFDTLSPIVTLFNNKALELLALIP